MLGEHVLLVAVLGIAAGCTPCTAQSPLTYRDSTGTREISIVIGEEPLPTGSLLAVDGVFEGKPVARSLRIDARPWYQSMEWSLHDYVRSQSREPLRNWVVHPWEAKAYLLQARGEGIDEITLYLRYEGVRGLPGTPRTTIELPGDG